MNKCEPPESQCLFHHRRTGQQFIFNQTDASLDDGWHDAAFESIWNRLSSQFPRVAVDKAFLDRALERMSMETAFGTIAARVDASPYTGKKHDNGQVARGWLSAARVIDDICRPIGWEWGLLKQSAIGIFLPGQNETGCRKVARNIRRQLVRQGPNSVSMGIALHPTLDLPRREAMGNALKALDHAYFYGPGSTVAVDAVTFNINGDQRYQQGDVAGAIEQYKLGLRLDPTDVNLRNSLGVCYGVEKKYDLAREEFAAATQLDPQAVMPIYNLGLVKGLSGDFKGALACLASAAALGEPLFEISFTTGKLNLESGHPAKGLKHLKEAVAIKPLSHSAHRLLGQCHQRLGQLKAAVSAYKKTIKLKPDDAESLSSLGLLYVQLNQNLEIALIFCRQSVKIAPQNGRYHQRLGRVLLNNGCVEDALAAFEEASRLGCDSQTYLEKLHTRRLDRRLVS